MAASNLLKYPGDLAQEHADWVGFQFFKYNGAFQSTGAAGAAPTTAGFLASYNALSTTQYERSELPTIGLYMPEDISANYSATWGGRDFSPLGAAMLRSVGQSINSQTNTSLEDFTKAAANSVDNLKGGLIPWFAAKAVAGAMNIVPGMGGGVTTNDVLASTQGSILNPNTEVLYSAPQLRTFGLTFKMVPRNEAESDIIRTICNSFKKASLPKATSRSGGDARNLIGVPDIVKITFYHKDKVNKWVSQFKHCAIGGVDINYTPDGAWSTYRTGAPVAVTLGLQFSELKLLFSEEVESGGY
jgi:hypothetical protein